MKNIGKTKKKNSVHCALSSRECTMVLYGVWVKYKNLKTEQLVRILDSKSGRLE